MEVLYRAVNFTDKVHKNDITGNKLAKIVSELKFPSLLIETPPSLLRIVRTVWR